MVPLTEAASLAAPVLPPGRGGWWHAYVCPVHGVELAHDGLLTGVFPPGGARCRHGCRVDDPAVRDAWTVLAHQACARRLRALARSSRPGHRAAATRLLVGYADRYAALGGAAHGEAAEWMLRGRLFHQALTEAVWAVTVGQAVQALRAAGDPLPAEVSGLLAALTDAAGQARDSLVADGRFDSNYTAWLIAAGAVCSGRPEWLTGPYGLHAHVLAAVRPDGWEWEAATYYHHFVLRAYLLAVGARPETPLPPPVRERLVAMAAVLDTITTPGGLLPMLHDGPYLRPEAEHELAELAELRPLLGDVPAAADPVVCYPDAGYALLRGHGLHALVDFGPHGGSHGHLDKLSLYLYGADTPWQPDPGQVPYAHRGWRRHYRSTVAHPTFRVDGLEQAECAGRLIGHDRRSVSVGCDDAYPRVSARRELSRRDGALVDELVVTADRPRRITLGLRPDVELAVRPAADGGFDTVWSGRQVLRGRHQASVAADLVVRPGPGPADDPQRTRTWVDWSVEDATAVTFRSVYRLGA
ncbi:heparinase II/III family protein [Micromonospora sp. WMMD1076]|uniref:heparinase II/III domain-containing protein n=1 Tax=Micromonospora sp. WMMD1076 TaxID=3016103 RepID=UPI00249ACE40|nr:heparinase II/III family protein [Micromonospora sp. WMMD1076]WFF04495.1 heparinase II/III family protein [Micromonospora sp. WMMD1076]